MVHIVFLKHDWGHNSLLSICLLGLLLLCLQDLSWNWKSSSSLAEKNVSLHSTPSLWEISSSLICAYTWLKKISSFVAFQHLDSHINQLLSNCARRFSYILVTALCAIVWILCACFKTWLHLLVLFSVCASLSLHWLLLSSFCIIWWLLGWELALEPTVSFLTILMIPCACLSHIISACKTTTGNTVLICVMKHSN